MFGDWEPADALDREPADAEQVARKLHAIRRTRDLEQVGWEQLAEPERAVLVAVVGALLAWLRRQGAAL